MRAFHLCLMFCFAASNSMACQPLDPKFWEASPARVKSNFDGAQFVVIANIVDVRKASVAPNPDTDFVFEVERATFRVEHSFKGTQRPGDTFTVDSGMSSCARGVSDKQRFANKSLSSKSDYTKRWLIYYTPAPQMPRPGPQLPPFEITDSPLSIPAGLASYDIDVLLRSSNKWLKLGPAESKGAVRK